MEITSSLLNDKYFAAVKASLIAVSEKDNKEDFRVHLIEYINDTADNNDDMFFFDMVEFVRFLNPSDDSIAYTTPDHLIYLNSPGEVGESVRKWDFIYCHECLHQLWETFGVADEIKEHGIDYNHTLLNIASDCVINDFLKRIKGKTPYENGVFPESLEKKFGVVYDPSEDTQFTLYLKLLEAYKQHKDAMDKYAQDMDIDGQHSNDNGDGQGNGQSSNQQGDNQQSNGNGSSNDKSGDKGDQVGDGAGKDGDKKDERGNKGKGGDKKDGKGDEKSNDDKNADGKDGDKQDDKNGKPTSNDGGDGQGKGKSGNDDTPPVDIDLSKIRKRAENILNKYKDKIAGSIGQFCGKCKSSKQLRRPNLGINAKQGSATWNSQLNTCVNKYVRQRVASKKRKYEKTYRRVKRGTGYVEFGQPIEPGRRVKQDKMVINAAFYVDRSGSMSARIDNVFTAIFEIADGLTKSFKRESVVEKTEYRTFVFNTEMKEIDWGKKVGANGNTMDFEDILENIVEQTDNFMINIIVTDGQFNVNINKVKTLLKKLEGIVIVVANSKIAKIEQEAKHNLQLFFIQADTEFKL